MWQGIETLEIYIDSRENSFNDDLELLLKKIGNLNKEMADAQETIFELQKEVEIQCNNNRDLCEQLELLQQSFSWKITKPLRYIRYRMLQRKEQL